MERKDDAARGAPAMPVATAGSGGDVERVEVAGASPQPEPISWAEILGDQ